MARLLTRFEHFLLPPRCHLCGGPTRADGLCGPCTADLPWIARGCRTCGLPLSGPGVEESCGPCSIRPPPHTRSIIPFSYDFPVDRMLLALKFSGDLASGRALGALLATHLAADDALPPDLIVPMPLHHERLRERGYNQVLEIAIPVSRALGVPLDTRACRRSRHTSPQSSLDARHRASNVRGAFSCEARVAGLHIAVVDDICTTGSTLVALADAILAAGARGVEAWCIARTVDQGVKM